MPLTSRGHSSLERTNGRPLCPRCRAPLWSVRVEPEKTASETFQCPRCEHSHIEVDDDHSAQSKPLRCLTGGPFELSARCVEMLVACRSGTFPRSARCRLRWVLCQQKRRGAMRHLIPLATGVFLLAAAGHAGAGPVSPAGFSRADGGPPIILVQDKATKDETLKHKVKRVWRNLTGYKFDVSCPFRHQSCTETGKSRDDARSKCIARNPVCWVADAQ